MPSSALKAALFLSAVAATFCLVMPAAAAQEPDPDAKKIQAGDVLFLDVYRRPELSSSVQVDGSGAIAVPYIGNINVSGMTEQEAAAQIVSALKLILKNPRVTLSRTGGSVEGARAPDMKTQIIPLNNSNAEDLALAMQGMSSQGGSIGADRSTNSLIVTDTPLAIQNIGSAVQQLDQMPSQVTQVQIEAKIAEVEQGAMKELGIRWFTKGSEVAGGYYPPRSQDAVSNSSLAGLDPLANERIGAGGTGTGGGGIDRRFTNGQNFDRLLNVPVHVPVMGQMFFGLMNGSVDIGVLLDALVKDNKAELLATPYITAVNHEQAEIKMTDEFPYTESSQTFGSLAYSVKFLDLGIKLLVTPHVYKDAQGPYIKLDLNPEVSFANGMANGVPIRSVRSSNSVANVRDGQTLVIGGIVLSDERNVEQRVPGLGKIPLVGGLFKRKERARTRNELMVFVTPRIHNTPETITWDRMINLSGAAQNETPAIPVNDTRGDTRKE
jgi:type II secretory pathway component GspD/PulD (secretin)